jgi:hypothetical protein
VNSSFNNHGEAPPEIADLVRQRTEARTRHDWRAADDIKARIEAAGWRVTDHGKRTSVGPAAPPTAEIEGELRYGSAAAVPSRLEEPSTAPWTVIVIASEEPARFTRFMAALREYAAPGTQVVVVVNDPSAAQEIALLPGSPERAPIAGSPPELVRTSVRLGYAAVLNIGLRRAAGERILLADSTVVPSGDALAPLTAALADPEIAAAGGCGLVAEDPDEPRPNLLVRLEATATPTEVMALELGWLAFRRADMLTHGPLDEHFVTPAWLDTWWTLRLRFGPPDLAADDEAAPVEADVEATAGAAPAPAPVDAAADATAEELAAPAPRRAVAIALPLVRDDVAWPPERTRLNRRNMYRVIDEFGAVWAPETA